MNLVALLRVFFWSVAAGFFADVLRRCWIVGAWSIFPIAAGLALIALWRTRLAWLAVRRRRLPADFVRPNLPH